jgi:hypothetical protein
MMSDQHSHTLEFANQGPAHRFGELTEYDRGYREGYAQATGHYPGCHRINDHMQGASVCSSCGRTNRHGVGQEHTHG